MSCEAVKKSKIVCLVVFIICLFVRIYQINRVESVHIDSALTSTITYSVNPKGVTYYIPQGEYTGRQLKEIFIPKHKANISADLKNIYLKSGNDALHPNLYYFFFRFFTHSAPNLDLQNLIKYGCGLNLIFFSFSFFLMYKLLDELFSKKDIIPFGLCVAFLNTSSISMTLFVRSYEMQATAVIFFVYAFVKLIKKIKIGEKFSKSDVLILFSSSLFCMLSAYLLNMVLGILYASIIVFLMLKKRFRDILTIFVVGIFTMLCSFLIYPNYYAVLFASKMGEINSHTGSVGMLSALKFGYCRCLLTSHLFYIYSIIILIIGSFFKSETKSRTYLQTFLIITFFALFSMLCYISPFPLLRYCSPMFPIMALLYPYILQNKTFIVRTIFSVLIAMTMLYASIFAKNVEEFEKPDYIIQTGHFYNLPTIQNLFIGHDKKRIFTQKPEYPVLFFYNGIEDYVDLIYFMADEQKYIFYNTYPLSTSDIIQAIKKHNLKNFYLAIPTNTRININGYTKRSYNAFEMFYELNFK